MTMAKRQTPIGTPVLTEGQRAYESRRAAKAGMTLERWLDQKRRAEAAEAAAKLKDAKEKDARAAPAAKKSLIGRLIDRAHKPLA